MAWTYSCNNSHTSQQALYELKEKLKAAGWTVLKSGDGTGGNYSSNSDILTTYSTTTEPTANAVTNRQAWWLIEAPDGRQLLWQHDAYNIAADTISVAYSRAAGFVGTDDGTVDADTAPTGTDAFLVMGDSRPSATMSGNSFGGGATITRADYIIGDADEGWAFACYLRDAAGAVLGGFFYDCLVNPQAGDSDPYILWSPGCYTTPFANAGGVLDSWYPPFWSYGDAGVGTSPTLAQSNGGPLGRPSRNAPREDAAQMYGILQPTYAGSVEDILELGGTVNPYDGANIDLLQPVWYAAAAITNVGNNTPWGQIAPVGEIKGESRFILALSPNAAQANRDTAQSLTLMAQAAGYWLRWDGATTPT